MSRVPALADASRRRLTALVALLSLTLAAGTYLQSVLSVLSTYIVRQFSISRSQLGFALTAFFVTAGATSPFLGKLSDRAVRRVMAGLFLVSALAVLLVAGAPSYPWVVVAAALGGLGLAAANPVTNRLISESIPVARQGVVIGIKQAGAPLGLFAAGLVLAPAAVALGWRWALALTALIPLLCLGVTWRLLPGDMSKQAGGARQPVPCRPSGRVTMWWLAGISLAVSAGVGAVVGFVALYAHEELQMSASVAGLVAGALGMAGIVGRIGWGAGACHLKSPTTALTMLAALSFVSTLTIWAAGTVTGLIWVGAVGAGLSMMAWHAVAWLVLLNTSDPAEIGRTTGVVQFGTSMGSATGPPIMGILVDRTGSYTWGWGFVGLLFLVVLGLTVAWQHIPEAAARRQCPGGSAPCAEGSVG